MSFRITKQMFCDGEKGKFEPGDPVINHKKIELWYFQCISPAARYSRPAEWTNDLPKLLYSCVITEHQNQPSSPSSILRNPSLVSLLSYQTEGTSNVRFRLVHAEGGHIRHRPEVNSIFEWKTLTWTKERCQYRAGSFANIDWSIQNCPDSTGQ